MGSRVVTFRRLGKHGRFANSLFQYAAMRIYANEHFCDLQVPQWIGTELFGLNDTPVACHLPPYHEKNVDGTCLTQGIPPEGNELVNHDFCGYGQYHTAYYRRHCSFFRDLYRPVKSIRERLQPAVDRLRKPDATIIGLHLRAGDYGRLIFYRTPVEWYLDWLKNNWSEYQNPVLFIAAEDRKLVDRFAEYNPITAESLGTELSTRPHANYSYLGPDRRMRDPWQMDFYPDFYLLSKCNVLLIPNSTFSFVAAMLAGSLQRCFRSNLPTQDFVEIDPWNAQPLTHDLAEDWRHVPDVCLDETAYWKRKGDGFEEIMS